MAGNNVDPQKIDQKLEDTRTEVEEMKSLLEKEKRNHVTLLNKLKMHDNSTQVTIQNLQKRLDELEKDQQLVLNQLLDEERSHIVATEELKTFLVNPADDITCSICLCSWESTGPHCVASLPCGHIFGMSCIQQCVLRTQLCPQCRAPVCYCDILCHPPS
ncbi:ERAD-associated E3 ubiquitin-protein ligase HRD1A-like [Drosophila madeirensis]|uniref:ERAD-associated E3 ubiquitin-protein ligase HRD1A-like n=1 Tax=Drosophila madeirensis TaxID=30013 RepID=A0AAU9FHZ5_DROMD